MKLRHIFYALPFGCLIYFHKKKNELLVLIKVIDDHGSFWRSKVLFRRYQILSLKATLLMVAAITPSTILFYTELSINSFLILLITLSIIHNYGELITALIIRRWIDPEIKAFVAEQELVYKGETK